ncbi:hypothetical protein [Luteimonas sp. R10]|nr:hypothetical protein U3649_04220 [Luteimonas sp. R10]
MTFSGSMPKALMVELVRTDDEMRAATSLLCEVFPEEAELRALDF